MTQLPVGFRKRFCGPWQVHRCCAWPTARVLKWIGRVGWFCRYSGNSGYERYSCLQSLRRRSIRNRPIAGCSGMQQDADFPCHHDPSGVPCVPVVVVPRCPVAMRGRQCLIPCVGKETGKQAGWDNDRTGMDVINDGESGGPGRQCVNFGRMRCQP